MIIDKIGKYRTNREYKGGNAASVWTIPAGTEFTVTQIDKSRHKFISSMFGDWEYWDRDVTYLGGDSDN